MHLCRYFISFVLPLVLCHRNHAAGPLELVSPGHTIMLVLEPGKKAPCYSVYAEGKMIIDRSPLGLELNGAEFFRNADAPIVLKEGVEETTVAGRGISSQVSSRFRHYTVGFGTARMEFRLFDEGIAFRYLFPAGPNRIGREFTGFNIAGNPRVWFFERTNAWKLKSYAGWWSHTAMDSLGTVSPGGPVQGKPLVMQTNSGKYFFLTEAALFNYSGLRFRANGNMLTADLTEGDQGFLTDASLPSSPWRMIGYARDLNELVNNPLIRCLSPGPDKKLFSDVSYIREGKSVWSWISRGKDYLDPAHERKFIDAAAQLHFDYTLIDEGWETSWKNKWETLGNLVDHAAAQKIGVWVWKDSKYLRDSIYRDRFLDSLQQTGVAGIKIDFMNSEAYELISFETAFLEAAARHRLMVNFHGCHASTGESITYPNEMTREGVRGMELNIMKEPIPAWHNAALPFTRFLTGPADYTPGFFTKRGNTTLTHQLALLYLFDSPFQCIAEDPVTLTRSQVFRPVLPFLQTLPVTWDETIVLPASSIGEIAAIAKRKGEEWYIAAINGTDHENIFQVNTGFLGDKAYTMVTVEDHRDRFRVKKTVRSGKKDIRIELPPTGGELIHFKPI